MDTIFFSAAIALGLLVLLRTEAFFRFLARGRYEQFKISPTQIRVYQIIAAIVIVCAAQTLFQEIYDFLK